MEPTGTAGNWPRVEDWVETALYDPETGFYETGGRAGRREGSFLTSPEVGPLFGAVVARAIDELWRAAGQPARWTVVDAGAGPGTLARSILLAEPACLEDLDLILVERSAAQRSLHPAGVTSTDAMPGRADVIFANELLDNLPFGIEEATADGWATVRVGPDGSTAPDDGGTRRPTVERAIDWIDWARSIAPHVIVADYFDTMHALETRPWTDWVRAFAGQERVDDPFVEPGSRDVTVVVPLDLLTPPTNVATQADWLRRHGIDVLVAEGEAYWQAHAANPDLVAVRHRSRATEAATLCAPDGLGAFIFAEWHDGQKPLKITDVLPI